MTRRNALCLAVLTIALYLLTGCIGRSQTETGAVTGIVAGHPLVIKWTRDTEGRTTVELPPALMDAAAAAAGATPWGAIIAGAVSIGVAAFAGRSSGTATAQRQRAEEHKADANEAWAKLVEKPAAGRPE